MFGPDEEDRLLASLDPIDPAELRSLLDDIDLAGQIMARPPEPAPQPVLATAKQDLGRRLLGLVDRSGPGIGRAAFATTVAAVVIAATVLFSVAPDQNDQDPAGPASGDDAAIDATTMTSIVVTVPESSPPTADGDADRDGAISSTTIGTPASAAGDDAAPSTSRVMASASSITLQPAPSTVAGSETSIGTTTRRPEDPPTTTRPTSSRRPTTRPTTTTTRPTTSRPSTTRPSTSRPTTSRPTVTTTTNPPPPDNGPFDPTRDLLALHYDHVIYRDDGHATVAAREITDDLGTDPIVVGGAYSASNTRYNVESEAVMDATWGASGWHNAHDDRSGSVDAVARRWSTTLRDGGDVWVAEAGQSDFTAAVVRAVADALPATELSNRIHVVQHSLANERKTTGEDLAYLRATIDYIKIDDGNFDNDTADLKQLDQDFVDAALAGPLATAWSEAFDYLDPDQDLDFSDTVEVLHIVGVGRSDVADPGDFADYFMS